MTSIRRLAYTQSLLEDLEVLEAMISDGVFTDTTRRIGAELELALTDIRGGLATVAPEILKIYPHPNITAELACFNLEINATPQQYHGAALSLMRKEIEDLLAYIQSAARLYGARPCLAGIVPSLGIQDLSLENMSPYPRYSWLNQTLMNERGRAFELKLEGVDELHIEHDSVMLESVNTSFQLHFQVQPDEFSNLYNWAQALTAPLLSISANSPMLFGKRLWAETRIAVFQQTVDTRSQSQRLRGVLPRVHFGHDWLRNGITEIYKEDITRYHIWFEDDDIKSAADLYRAGEIPKLEALQRHNGSVWRWNRPCYGVQNGIPHLRIENRVLPAGPTVHDVMANAALYYGLMSYYSNRYSSPVEMLSFDAAKENFLSAAQFGLHSQLQWIDGQSYSAAALMLDELIPNATEGLRSARIAEDDIQKYMATLVGRASSGQTGARWITKSFQVLKNKNTGLQSDDQLLKQMVRRMIQYQEKDQPVHTWSDDFKENLHLQQIEATLTLKDVMVKEWVSVTPTDLAMLGIRALQWSDWSWIPVTDHLERLIGVIDKSSVERHAEASPLSTVEEVMSAVPPCLSGELPVTEIDLNILQAYDRLPVTEEGTMQGWINTSIAMHEAAQQTPQPAMVEDSHFESAPHR